MANKNPDLTGFIYLKKNKGIEGSPCLKGFIKVPLSFIDRFTHEADEEGMVMLDVALWHTKNNAEAVAGNVTLTYSAQQKEAALKSQSTAKSNGNGKRKYQDEEPIF